MTAFSDINLNLLYPDSDGKPMADNTEQYRWIVMIKGNLEILFAHEDDVFIAGDLLWYPVHSTLVAPTTPDVLVVFGRPKGKRGSYRQWQESNIPPQVVFEILSPSNTAAEMARKLEFYNTYGVEEFYLYDPDTLRFQGWQRQDDRLVEILPIADWISPRLQIRFVIGQRELEIYRSDSRRFLSSIELEDRAEQQSLRAEQETLRAESAEERARQAEAMLDCYRAQFGDLPDV